MSLRAIKPEFLERCPLSPHRQAFIEWAQNTLGGAFRKDEFAKVASGRPVESTHLVKVFMFVLDESPRNLRVASLCHQYLNENGVPRHARTPTGLISAVTLPAEAHDDPLSLGTTAIRNLWRLFRTPLAGVRPCADSAELRKVVTWQFIAGGRRAAGKRLPEPEAIAFAERTVHMSPEEFYNRLEKWRSQSPWSVTVAGPIGVDPWVMSIAAPVSHSLFEQLKTGQLDMFKQDLEGGITTSDRIYVESLSVNPHASLSFRLLWPTAYQFLAALSQQAMLSALDDIGEKQPLRILSIGASAESQKWLKRFGYSQLSVCTPLAGFPLWERVMWDDGGRIEAAELGVWRAIQRHFQGFPHPREGP